MVEPTTSSGLIDTDILIDFARGLPEAGIFLDSVQQSGNIFISVISAMELLSGCRDSKHLRETKRFLFQTKIVPISEDSSRTAYELIQQFNLSHGLLIPDSLIAATAIENQLPLFTRNVKHFQMISELNVIQPY